MTDTQLLMALAGLSIFGSILTAVLVKRHFKKKYGNEQF